MLDASLAAQLASLLEKVTHPIELESSLDDRPKSTELAQLPTAGVIDRSRLRETPPICSGASPATLDVSMALVR